MTDAALIALLTAESTRLKEAALSYPPGDKLRRHLREQMFDVLAAKQAVLDWQWRMTPCHTDIEEPCR